MVANNQHAPAHVPIRMCVGCRERATKRELLRVVLAPGDADRTVVVPDPTGAAAGRGAHLHPTSACYDLAVRRRAFGRALRATDPDSTPVSEWLAARTPDRD